MVKIPFYFHLISRENFLPLFACRVWHETIFSPLETFTRKQQYRVEEQQKQQQQQQQHQEKKIESHCKKCPEIFVSFMRKKKKQSECTSDTCSLCTSGVAFCCVLAFALLMYIWSKNFHPYAIVHNKQSKAFFFFLLQFARIFLTCFLLLQVDPAWKQLLLPHWILLKR